MGDLTATEAVAIADKDLPEIKPADIKLDTSAVDTLKPAELVVVQQKWVSGARTNEQLVLLIKQCPEKIARLEAMKVEPYIIGSPAKDTASIDAKIARLKEQYAVCIKEIKSRRAKAVVDVG